MGSTGANKCIKAYSASKVVRTIAGRLISSAPFIFHGSASVKYLENKGNKNDKKNKNKNKMKLDSKKLDRKNL